MKELPEYRERYEKLVAGQAGDNLRYLNSALENILSIKDLTTQRCMQILDSFIGMLEKGGKFYACVGEEIKMLEEKGLLPTSNEQLETYLLFLNSFQPNFASSSIIRFNEKKLLQVKDSPDILLLMLECRPKAKETVISEQVAHSWGSYLNDFVVPVTKLAEKGIVITDPENRFLGSVLKEMSQDQKKKWIRDDFVKLLSTFATQYLAANTDEKQKITQFCQFCAELKLLTIEVSSNGYHGKEVTTKKELIVKTLFDLLSQELPDTTEVLNRQYSPVSDEEIKWLLRNGTIKGKGEEEIRTSVDNLLRQTALTQFSIYKPRFDTMQVTMRPDFMSNVDVCFYSYSTLLEVLAVKDNPVKGMTDKDEKIKFAKRLHQHIFESYSPTRNSEDNIEAICSAISSFQPSSSSKLGL